VRFDGTKYTLTGTAISRLAEQVLELLKSGGEWKLSQLRNALGRSGSDISAALSELREVGAVTFERRGRSLIWYALPEIKITQSG